MKIRLLDEMSKNNTNNSGGGLIFALEGAMPPPKPLDMPMNVCIENYNENKCIPFF
jgi:hypothetical protein